MRPKRLSRAITNAQKYPLTSTNTHWSTILTFSKIEDSRATLEHIFAIPVYSQYLLAPLSESLNLSYVLKSEVCAPGGVNALVVVLKLGPSK